MFYIAVAFLAGTCSLHGLSQLPALSWGCVGLGVSFSLSALVLLLRRRRIALALAAATCGFAFAWVQAQARLSDRWPAASSGTDVEVVGAIASIVTTYDDHVRFLVDVCDAPLKVPKHVEISWYDTAARPHPGEVWRLNVRLRAPHGFANPGGYDYEAQLLRENIGATGYVREDKRNERLSAPRWSYLVLRVRDRVARALASALSGSRFIGIVQGLSVGETSEMTSEQWRVFARTGTTHLMAISGMHIAMVALLAAFLAGRLARRYARQTSRLSALHIETVVGMSVGVLYSMLAGLSVPTQRTMIMLSVVFLARLRRRALAPLQTYGVALVAVLLWDPFAPLAPGFWLSFGAVGILFLAEAGRMFVGSKVGAFFRAQGAVTIGLTPLLFALFGSVSLIAPFVNLAAIPLFTLIIVPLVLTATALLTVSISLGSALLKLIELLLNLIWPALQWVSELPWAVWPLPQAPWWAIVLLILGACALLAPGVIATRIAGIMLCLPAFFWRPELPAQGDFELTALDVGQGLATVVRTHSHVLLYDTGPQFRGGRDTGEMVVVPFLHAKGIRVVDTVVVSHGDSDHVGGLQSVLALSGARRLLVGPSVVIDAPAERCARGQRWTWDGVEFEILYPREESNAGVGNGRRDRNDTSCVVRVRGSGASALLLGDVEAVAERMLLAEEALTPTDVVIVPHHGSRTSSTPELVARTAPRYAVVSAGFQNRFGFPKAEVVARWQSQGAEVVQTANSGALSFLGTHSGMRAPRAERSVERRYWRE